MQIPYYPYYGTYVVTRGELEVYRLDDLTYQPVAPNERGQYPISQMNVELGVWRGSYLGQPKRPWLRWWDLRGNLLLTGKERAEISQQQAEQERQKRQQLALRLKDLAPEQLQALGIDPARLE